MARTHAGSTLLETPGTPVSAQVSAPFLFLALELERPHGGSARWGLGDVDVVTLGRGDSRSSTRVEKDGKRHLRVKVPGGFLSSTHARLLREGDGWVFTDEGSRNGSMVNGLSVTRRELADGDVLELGRTAWVFRDNVRKLPGTRDDLDSAQQGAPAGLATVVPGLSDALDALMRVAATNLPVLLRGETGTGKEVLARAIHVHSARPGAFVAVNCGALAQTLVEAQLFGHVKGSFTGALRDEPGFVRAADGGTLFLDEIGDLPRAAQAALLRVIQEQEVVPVGSTRAVPVDIRLVAATHRPLDEMVARDEFRADLHARLNGCTHHLLPLRDRREDMGILLAHLLPTPKEGPPAVFTPDAGRALMRYAWPANIRELQQCLALARALSQGGPIGVEHLPPALTQEPVRRAPTAPPPRPDKRLSPEDEQLRARVVELLHVHHGNVKEVAAAMGKARMQVHRWMKRFGIDPDEMR